jgi:DNA invertase Pin-like site-specific DNA recombinase
MSKKVIELIRVSTKGQAAEDRGGIPAQHAANLRTANLFNLEVVRTIEIIDVSGASVLKSPQMMQLLDLMEDQEIHGVVTKEFSRLMRPENFNDYALLQHFIDTRCLLYLPDGPIDLNSNTGRIIGPMRAAMAGTERQEIRERMQGGKEALRRAGKHPSGYTTLPYGVAYSKASGWVFTPQAEKVKHAFSLFLSGQTSYTEIGRALNLPKSNVRYLLQNPIYTGWKVWDEKRDPSPQAKRERPDGGQHDRKRIKRTPEEVVRRKVLPPLVGEEDFGRVQQAIELKRRKHWRVRSETARRYVYNGFLTCGDGCCASLIYTHSAKQDFYACSSHHPRERRRRALAGLAPCTNRYMLRKRLEPKIDYLLGRKLREPEFLERIVGEYNRRLPAQQVSLSVDVDNVKARLGGLAEKRERVLDAFFEGTIDKGERDHRLEGIARETETFRKLLTESACDQSDLKPLSLEAIASVIEPFFEWEFLQREDKRFLLGLLCPEIAVYQYNVKALTLNLAAKTTGGDENRRRRTAW